MTNKIRKQLEKQKKVLSKRIKKNKKNLKLQAKRGKNPWRVSEKRRRGLLLARANQQIDAVNDAIKRMGEGNFGTCEVCGEPIDPKRLEALPTTTHCWRCLQNK